MKRISFVILAAYWLFTGCTSNDKPVAALAPAANKKVALMEPFKFHKAIESSPGQTFDVLSWGRGTDSVGAFMILHSDSSGRQYTTTTGDLDGAISDVYNSDMDTDGNPEILIQSKGRDTINFTKIYAFEFKNNDANKLDFPKLTSSQKKGYRGDDNFYIRDGKLIREFPIFDGNTSAAKPTGAKRQLEYGLHGNSFTVTQLSKDSVSVAAPAPEPAKVIEKPKKSAGKVKKSSSKKKKKSTPTHKKRRRRN